MGGGKPVKWSFVDFSGIIFNNVEACSLWTMPHKVSLNQPQSNIDNTTLIPGQSGSAWILFSPNVGITNINLAGSTEYGFQESSVVPYISHTNEDSYLVESLNIEKERLDIGLLANNLKTMKFKPLYDRVLIRRIEQGGVCYGDNCVKYLINPGVFVRQEFTKNINFSSNLDATSYNIINGERNAILTTGIAIPRMCGNTTTSVVTGSLSIIVTYKSIQFVIPFSYVVSCNNQFLDENYNSSINVFGSMNGVSSKYCSYSTNSIPMSGFNVNSTINVPITTMTCTIPNSNVVITVKPTLVGSDIKINKVEQGNSMLVCLNSSSNNNSGQEGCAENIWSLDVSIR